MNRVLSNPTGLPCFDDVDVSFQIVDSHHHLFDLSALYYPWLTDKPEQGFLLGEYDDLKKNYLPADYRRDAGNLNIVKTVHVEAEADHNNSISETIWLCEIARQSDLPNAIVAHAWLHREDSVLELAAHAEYDAVRGIRSKPVTSYSIGTRNDVFGAPASMQDPAWRRGLGRLREFGFSYDLRVPYWHLNEAVEVCGLYPDLKVVIEHTGLPWDRTDEGLVEWRRAMAKLAALENVYLKISELGLNGARWDYANNRRVVREAIELFGFSRCMFASNFPVAGLRIGFVDQVCAIATMIEDATAVERDQLFRGTASEFYRL